MRLRHCLLFFFLLTQSWYMSAQSPFDYSAAWQEVDTLLKQNLTRSALEEVERIEVAAKKESQDPQFIKAVLYGLGLQRRVEEKGDSLVISRLQAEIAEASQPNQAIFQSYLADLLYQYYQEYRWQIMNRTETEETPADFQTWSAATFHRQIAELYQASLAPGFLLQSLPVRRYEAILDTAKESEILRPSLYDLLAHRAIDKLGNADLYLNEPQVSFRISAEQGFLPAEDFVKAQIESPDEQSLSWISLTTFQQLTAYHLQAGQIKALVEVELARMKFVRDQLNLADKETRYKEALDRLAIAYSKSPALSRILFAQARWYADQAQQMGRFKAEDPKAEAYVTAEGLCRQIKRQFPRSFASQQADGLLDEIRYQSLSFQLENPFLPNRPSRIKVEYRNVPRAYFRVIRLTESMEKTLEGFSYGDQEERFDYLRRQRALRNWSQSLRAYEDHHTHTTEVKMDPLSPGRYILLVANHSSFRYVGHAVGYSTIEATSMAFLTQDRRDGSREIWVVDRESGEPLPGLEVSATPIDPYNRNATVQDGKATINRKTDEQGKILLPYTDERRNSWALTITREREVYTHRLGWGYRYQEELPKPSAKTAFFTDRSIYRPGQTIYFKALAMERIGDQHRILPNHELQIVFRDVNRQEIGQQTLTTNEYGSVQGTFVAPAGGLTGQMSLSTSGGQVYVSVEEYKRPTFEVKLDPMTAAVKLNDEVSLTGSASSLAGAAVNGAEVRFRVERRARFPYALRWWLPPLPSNGQEIANGTVQTDAEGKFTFNFTAQADPDISPEDKPVFTYQVYVDVIDITGETRSTESSFRLGYQSLEIGLEIPQSIEKSEGVTIQLTTNNLNGEFVPTQGKIRISPVETPQVNYRPRLWEPVDQQLYSEISFRRWFPRDQYAEEAKAQNWPVGEALVEESFDTGVSTEMSIAAVQALPPGYYQMVMETGGGLEVVKYFTLFNPFRKSPPTSTWLEVELDKQRAEPGEAVTLALTTSERDLWVWMQLTQANQVFEQRFVKLGAGRQEIPLQIEELHRGNLHLTVAYISHNHSKEFEERIQVPWTNQQLQLSWESFRSPLQPGQHEQWKLRIRGPKAETVAAEMVATLYDASLDQFKAHNYALNLYPSYGNYLRVDTRPFGTNNGSIDGENWNESRNTPSQSFDQLNPCGLFLGYSGRYLAVGGLLMADDAVAMPRMAMAAAPSRERAKAEAFTAEEDASYKALVLPEPEESSSNSPSSPPPLRKNLQETAFFFPQLQTNAEGEIVLDFTMPEALTRWKFLGLAHTQDLKIGTLGGETVTQKELMVVPNLPRFFREQDQMVLRGKVVNLTDKSLSGTAKLELVDATAEQNVDALFTNGEASRAFSVPPKGSVALDWAITVPEGLSAIAVRMYASAGEFTDGEENVLPVLTNRMLVTETKPLTMRGKKEKFTFDRLVEASNSPTLQHHKLTLDITTNPAWEAVRSLPYLMEFPHQCTEQIFSRFYANALGTHIANSDPRIAETFQTWADMPDGSGFASKLQQNEALKTAMLSETPWVVEAKSQAERQKRLGTLLDLSRMQEELAKSQQQIRQRQNSDGGFSWFPGMQNSEYITQLIATGFGHLQQLGVSTVGDPEQQQMLAQAVSFVDGKRAEAYAKLIEQKADMKANHLSYSAVNYLYMRSFFREQPLGEAGNEAFDFYFNQAKTYWTSQTPYMQGMLSLVFHRYEEQKLAEQVIAALKENAVMSEKLGMYWKQDRGWFWYQAPIEQQAMMIEAFHEVGKDLASVEEQKVWLLQNKRTNDWGSTRATVAACHALLLTGSELLSEPGSISLKVGGENVEIPADQTAGTGQFQVHWDGTEITPELAEVQIKRKSKSLAFGGMFWQYFEQLDKITPAETPLSVQKSLWKQVNTDRGPELQVISEEAPLKAGDKLTVRIELRVDRDMEYVHLKDMRAAGLEPIEVLSRYRYEGGLGFYQSTKDAATHFFMDRLPKGTYVLEYDLRVSLPGDFSNGITSLQCMYAPEFSSHSAGARIQVVE